ncbi:hypothetical protein sos41_33580 [Alphaproteobacteria bacterium SO-S41]|nr:hypothetical protein sos41_33580 [Alphaproteobacteria bacterium SO-S41]
MITASCHCGAVRMEIDAEAPETVLSCGCSICRRKGGLWTYYEPRQVKIIPESGATSIYLWGDKMLEHHTCKTCGCTTHWSPVDKTYPRMGVNARMMEPEILAAATVRHSPGPTE